MVPNMQLGSKATKREKAIDLVNIGKGYATLQESLFDLLKHDMMPLDKEQQINPRSLLWNRSLLLLSVG